MEEEPKPDEIGEARYGVLYIDTGVDKRN